MANKKNRPNFNLFEKNESTFNPLSAYLPTPTAPTDQPPVRAPFTPDAAWAAAQQASQTAAEREDPLRVFIRNRKAQGKTNEEIAQEWQKQKDLTAPRQESGPAPTVDAPFAYSEWSSTANLAENLGKFALNAPANAYNIAAGSVNTWYGAAKRATEYTPEQNLQAIADTGAGLAKNAYERATQKGAFENLSDIASGTAKFAVENPIDFATAVLPGAAGVGKIAGTRVIAPIGEAVAGTTAKAASKLGKVSTELYDTAIANVDKAKKAGYQANPYQKEYFDDLLAKHESPEGVQDIREVQNQHLEKVAEQVQRAVEEKKAALSEDSPVYKAIRDSSDQVGASEVLSGFRQILKDNGLSIKGGKVVKLPEAKSVEINQADLSKLDSLYQAIRNESKANNTLTASQMLDLRKAASNLAKYDASSTTKGQSVARAIRSMIDTSAKNGIKGLREIDKNYADKIGELDDVTRDLVYKQGDAKGDFRSNLNSIIKNINTPNRARLLERLQESLPDLSERVQAINNLPELHKALTTTNFKGKYLNAVSGAAAGAATGLVYGGPLGAVAGFILGWAGGGTAEKVLTALKARRLNSIIGNLSEAGRKRLAEINAKIARNAELRSADKEFVQKIRESVENEETTSKNTVRSTEKQKVPSSTVEGNDVEPTTSISYASRKYEEQKEIQDTSRGNRTINRDIAGIGSKGWVMNVTPSKQLKLFQWKWYMPVRVALDEDDKLVMKYNSLSKKPFTSDSQNRKRLTDMKSIIDSLKKNGFESVKSIQERAQYILDEARKVRKKDSEELLDIRKKK